MSIREKLARQALALAAEDRVFLADILEQSLSAEEGSAAAEIEAAWSAEIDRRIGAYDRGEVQAVDFEMALGQMRQHLADHRSPTTTS